MRITIDPLISIETLKVLSSENKFIDRQTISELLYGEEQHIEAFTNATKKSYGEFIDQYRKHLLNQDMANLRKAGHKIKPVSEMLNLTIIIEEYEHGKSLLKDPSTTEDQLTSSVKRMEKHIEEIIKELDHIE